MIVAWLAVAVACTSALVYALSTNPRIMELARLAFHAAMIGLMIACATKAVTLLG